MMLNNTITRGFSNKSTIEKEEEEKTSSSDSTTSIIETKVDIPKNLTFLQRIRMRTDNKNFGNKKKVLPLDQRERRKTIKRVT